MEIETLQLKVVLDTIHREKDATGKSKENSQTKKNRFSQTRKIKGPFLKVDKIHITCLYVKL